MPVTSVYICVFRHYRVHIEKKIRSAIIVDFKLDFRKNRIKAAYRNSLYFNLSIS